MEPNLDPGDLMVPYADLERMTGFVLSPLIVALIAIAILTLAAILLILFKLHRKPLIFVLSLLVVGALGTVPLSIMLNNNDLVHQNYFNCTKIVDNLAKKYSATIGDNHKKCGSFADGESDRALLMLGYDESTLQKKYNLNSYLAKSVSKSLKTDASQIEKAMLINDTGRYSGQPFQSILFDEKTGAMLESNLVLAYFGPNGDDAGKVSIAIVSKSGALGSVTEQQIYRDLT